MRSIFTTIFLVAVAASPAVACPHVPPKPTDDGMAKTENCGAAAQRIRKIDIDQAEDLVGNIPKNDGERIDAIKLSHAGSLIRLRATFIAEIVKTANDL